MPISTSIERQLNALEGGWVATPVQCRSCFRKGSAVWQLDANHADPWGAEALFEGIAIVKCDGCGAVGPEHIPVEDLTEWEQRTVFNEEYEC